MQEEAVFDFLTKKALQRYKAGLLERPHPSILEVAKASGGISLHGLKDVLNSMAFPSVRRTFKGPSLRLYLDAFPYTFVTSKPLGSTVSSGSVVHLVPGTEDPIAAGAEPDSKILQGCIAGEAKADGTKVEHAMLHGAVFGEDESNRCELTSSG